MAPARRGAERVDEGRTLFHGWNEISGRAPEKFDIHVPHPSPFWRPSRRPNPSRGSRRCRRSCRRGFERVRPDLARRDPSLELADGRSRGPVAVEMAEAGQRREERDQGGQRQRRAFTFIVVTSFRSGSPGAPPRPGDTAWPPARSSPSAPRDRPARSRLGAVADGGQLVEARFRGREHLLGLVEPVLLEQRASEHELRVPISSRWSSGRGACRAPDAPAPRRGRPSRCGGAPGRATRSRGRRQRRRPHPGVP